MDLYHLRTFLAIAEEGNLTRASSKLCLSQPAVSAKIKALEEELGVSLFHRTPQGMALSREGIILSKEAKVAIDAAENFMDVAKTINDNAPLEIALATISEPITLRLGQFLSLAMISDPNLRIRLKQLLSGHAIEHVKNGTVDAGFMIADFERKGVTGKKLSELTINIVAPQQWNDQLENTQWDQLIDLPWIHTPKDCGFNRIYSLVFDSGQKKPKIIIETDNEATLKDLVSSGVGVSFMRSDQALKAQEDGLVSIWPHGRIHTYLSFVHLDKNSNTRMVATVSNLVEEVWSDQINKIALAPPKGQRLNEYVYLDLDTPQPSAYAPVSF